MNDFFMFVVIFYLSFCSVDLDESLSTYIIKPVVFLLPIALCFMLENPIWPEFALIGLTWITGLLLHYKIIKEGRWLIAHIQLTT